MNFKDHFSGHSADYSSFRPTYPDKLFSSLSSLCSGHNLAWDCATGSGQAAASLVRYFDSVIATDASSNQITNAKQVPGIDYRIASAEQSGIESNSVDLITIAQALHWFDIPAFTCEADRVLKPGGILAVWSYNLLHIDTKLDNLIAHLYGEIVGQYWPFERQIVESGYETIEMPFDVLQLEVLEMKAQWNFSQLIGYLNTWSAVKAYEKDKAHNPVSIIMDELLKHWGDPAEYRIVRWQLVTKVWRKTYKA